MEPHKTFESINSDPKIADALRNLYDSPDMVEMYPGIFIEEISKASEGIRFPPAAGRGVLSDAVTLVRSDRFYTLVRHSAWNFIPCLTSALGLHDGYSDKLGPLRGCIRLQDVSQARNLSSGT